MSRKANGNNVLGAHLSRRGFLYGTAAALAGVSAFSAPRWAGNAFAQDGTPISGGTLNIALNADINGMDPHLSSTTVSTQVMTSLYDTLLDYDPAFNLVPRLAASWDVSADELEYTFHLVPGVTFHDGEPFNAAAVKANIERVLDDTLGARLTSQLTSVSEVRVVDDATVVIALSTPLALILPLMTGPAGAMISPKAITQYGKDLARNPVGTGPFKFVEWLDDDHITVARNETYWQQGLPYLDEIVYKPIPDTNVRLTALKTNEVQIDDVISAKDAASVKSDDSLVYDELPGLGYRYILFNSSQDPFTKPALRQAIAWSIDRAAINQVLFFGTGTVANTPIPPSSWAYDPSVVVYPNQDYDMAKQKLAEGGSPDGFEFTMMIPNTADDIQLGEAYKDQLGQVGINVNLETLEFQTLLDRSYAGDFQAHIGNWSGGPDPDDNVYSYFRSGGGTNRGRYLNPEVDTLLDQARSVADREQRKPLYNQLAQIITADAPMIFVVHPPEIKVWQPVVQGFVHSSDQLIRTASMWRSDAG
jgi:peptide/nickel transport system substrate-binding protein